MPMNRTSMKLSFIGENHLLGVEADAAFAAEHGFDGIEYNFWGDARNLTADTVKHMAAIHAKHGTRASMVGFCGFNHLARNVEERKEAHALLDRQIEYAQMLKASWIVTGCGDIPGEPAGRKAAEFARTFEPIFAKVQDAGLNIAFHALHGNSFLDSLETLERVWELVPDLKLKYDPANWRNHTPDYLEIPRRYGHKIGYVHIKDHLYKDGQLVSQPPAGMGSIEFPKLLAYLYEHSFNGYLSIEPHGPLWGHGELRRKMILISKRYLEPMLV